MNFAKIQDDIIEKIKTDFPEYLSEKNLVDFGDYVEDFLDLDSYCKAKEFFFNFENINFNSLSNQSNEEVINASFYMVFRKNKSSVLTTELKNYSNAFYNWFYEICNGNFSGIVDYGMINTVNFYNAVDADTGIKLAEFNVTLYVEI